MPMEILKVRDHLGNQDIDRGLLKYTLKNPDVRIRCGPYDTVAGCYEQSNKPSDSINSSKLVDIKDF
jgi:hypothetical protein